MYNLGIEKDNQGAEFIQKDGEEANGLHIQSQLKTVMLPPSSTPRPHDITPSRSIGSTDRWQLLVVALVGGLQLDWISKWYTDTPW